MVLFLHKHFPNFVKKARSDDDNLLVYGNHPEVVQTGTPGTQEGVQDQPHDANVLVDGEPMPVQTESLAKGPFGQGLGGMPTSEPKASAPKAMDTTGGLEKATGDNTMVPKMPSAPKPTQGGAAGTTAPQQPQMGGNTAPSMSKPPSQNMTGQQRPTPSPSPSMGSTPGGGTGGGGSPTNHKYTSRTMGPNGQYKYEYSGGVTGRPDAPADMDPQGAAAHHTESANWHAGNSTNLEQQARSADKQAQRSAPANQPAMQQQADGIRQQAQGHAHASQYHQGVSQQHQESAGPAPEVPVDPTADDATYRQGANPGPPTQASQLQ